MVAHAKSRNLAMWSIDVDAVDYRTRDPGTVHRRVMAGLKSHGKGIILFHDIQPSTAGALKGLLDELKAKGYKVVHLVPKVKAKTLPEYDAIAARELATRGAVAASKPLAPRAFTWPASTPPSPKPPTTGSITTPPPATQRPPTSAAPDHQPSAAQRHPRPLDAPKRPSHGSLGFSAIDSLWFARRHHPASLFLRRCSDLTRTTCLDAWLTVTIWPASPKKGQEMELVTRRFGLVLHVDHDDSAPRPAPNNF